EGVRSRSPLHRRYLGRGIQLRNADRRALGHPFNGDACLYRAAAGLFPRGIALGIGNSLARRCDACASQGLVGGRVRPNPVHANLVQALTPWTSTATAVATSSTRCRMWWPPPRNNLKKDGWVTGQTWGYEVVVPKGFNFLLADRSRVMAVQEWER